MREFVRRAIPTPIKLYSISVRVKFYEIDRPIEDFVHYVTGESALVAIRRLTEELEKVFGQNYISEIQWLKVIEVKDNII